jgi:hypothetical protein
VRTREQEITRTPTVDSGSGSSDGSSGLLQVVSTSSDGRSDGGLRRSRNDAVRRRMKHVSRGLDSVWGDPNSPGRDGLDNGSSGLGRVLGSRLDGLLGGRFDGLFFLLGNSLTGLRRNDSG